MYLYIYICICSCRETQTKYRLDNRTFSSLQRVSVAYCCSANHFDKLIVSISGHENGHSLDAEEQMQQTSSRKRKQFCPRRLLSEAERSNSENVPSLVAAQ